MGCHSKTVLFFFADWADVASLWRQEGDLLPRRSPFVVTFLHQLDRTLARLYHGAFHTYKLPA